MANCLHQTQYTDFIKRFSFLLENVQESATCYRLDDLGSIPSIVRFFCFPQHADWLCGHPSSVHWVEETLSLGVKQLGYEAYRSPPSSTYIKNGGATPALPQMSSWYSAWLIKHMDNFNFWTMNPLMFSRAWGFSTTPLSTIYANCIIGWATRHKDRLWGSDMNLLYFWYIRENGYAMEMQDSDDLISHILVAAADIRGQPRTLVCTVDSIQCCCEACT